MNRFRNYRSLIRKIDEKCAEILSVYRNVIQCRKGCCECCRHISVFPVEAAFIGNAFEKLPRHIAESVLKTSRHASRKENCPLLMNGACVLYDARPVICRTHGLPLMMTTDEKTLLGYCPHNFRSIETLRRNAVIDADQMNLMLSAVNHVFVSRHISGAIPERLTIGEALRFYRQ